MGNSGMGSDTMIFSHVYLPHFSGAAAGDPDRIKEVALGWAG